MKGRLGVLLLAALLGGCRRDVPGSGPASGNASAAATAVVAPPVPAASPAPAAQAEEAPRRVVKRRADGCLEAAPAVSKAPAPPLPLSGRLGLWVAELDPRTLEPLRAVGTNPDSVFPLASTYKQAVLWAVLREFDAGRLSPTERFDVTRQNQSLGRYPYDGTNVRGLTDLMIRWSDNTATDILHRRVGMQRVQDVADGLGLCRTRLILPTRDWWVAQSGLSATYSGTKRWAGATGAERLRLAKLIDHDAQAYRSDYVQRKLDGYFDHRHQPADDLNAHNISTPYEFATLIAHQNLRPGLSPRALNWQRGVLATGYGRAALTAERAGNVTAFAGKGGNGWRLLTYTGYLRTRGGRHVVYAFMQHGAKETYTMPNTSRAFAWINAGIHAVLGKQKPPATAGSATGRPHTRPDAKPPSAP